MELENKDLQDQEEEIIQEETQKITLTRTKKIILLVIGVFSYFFFLLFFLPYSNFLKIFLNKSFKDYKIEYSSLELGIFSPIVFKNLYFSNQFDFFLRADQLTLKLNLWKLLNQNLKGEIFIRDGNIKIKDLDVDLNNFIFNVDLDNSYDTPLEKWNGNILLQIKTIDLNELFGPLKNFSLDEEQKKIKNSKISITIVKGNYDIKNFQFDSELFRAKGNFSGNLQTNIAISTISGKLCLVPVQNLEEKNPVIYGIYISAGGSLGGELCLKISGNFSDPKFEVENKN